MRFIAAPFAAVLFAAASAPAAVLYDSNGFEDFDAGTMASGGAWSVGVASPQPDIVDAGEPHGQAMRIYGPLGASTNSNNVLSFDAQTEGTLTLSFDMLTSTNFRSLNILITQAGSTAGTVFSNTTTSIAIGRTPNTIEHYVGGWQAVGSFELDTWQHVDIVVHLSGDDAGTFDVVINDTPTATGVAWRNSFTPGDGSAIGEIWFQGQGRSEAQGGGTTSRYTQLDNVTVAWVPEPGSLGVMSLGLLCARRRR